MYQLQWKLSSFRNLFTNNGCVPLEYQYEIGVVVWYWIHSGEIETISCFDWFLPGLVGNHITQYEISVEYNCW